MTALRRLPRPGLALAIALAPAPPLIPAAAGDAKYLEDFEFLRRTVADDAAALRTRKIDWAAACARLRPLFADCESDRDHVRNCMRLLAVLSDSHTGVTRSSVGFEGLPSRWDGLYGGGLWLGWDRGYLVLMGVMDGHPLAGTVPPGSAVAAVDGLPTWLALLREERRITEYAGASSLHSLFSSMDNRLLPFGDKPSVEVLFLTPEGKERKVSVLRWGPGGKAFYPSTATLPGGVEWKEGATSAFLGIEGCGRLGYLRVTGGMDAATVEAFHRAFDALEGMEACLLDCRGMGGGGDGPAWEMAGRFYPGGVDNGLHGRIEASGSWQFDGPVVMLQDEKEVSSAETFTWAMSETGRAVSVGRPTGGWGIIPRGYSTPSGIVGFRLGVNDRPTPIRRVHTEGVGWPPDVTVPYGPVLRAAKDPVMDVGLDVLRMLVAGADRERTRALFHDLMEGEVEEFAKQAPKLAEAEGFDPRRLARLVEEDLAGRLLQEALLLEMDGAGPPDALGAAARLADLAPRAKAAGLKTPLARLEKALKRLRDEAAAQEDFLAVTDRALSAPEDDRKAFLSRHRKTALAAWLRENLW